jgi:hypothetical protein
MKRNRRKTPETPEEHRARSRRGGKAGRGAAKCRRDQMLTFWQKVRAGEVPKPKPRGKAKPKQMILEGIDDAK